MASPSELLEIARELGVKLVPCQMSMDLLGLSRDDMIDVWTNRPGAAAMLSRHKTRSRSSSEEAVMTNVVRHEEGDLRSVRAAA